MVRILQNPTTFSHLLPTHLPDLQRLLTEVLVLLLLFSVFSFLKQELVVLVLVDLFGDICRHVLGPKDIVWQVFEVFHTE